MQQHSSQGILARGTAESTARRSAAEYGSDVVIELLRDLGVEYAAFNPGASFRGLHDSLVNFGEGPSPKIVLCCHEEIAVAIAAGYARVTGRPMAAPLHDVVGLQHGTMAIFCAWTDRLPVILMGGTGPMDSTKRRPHIDWVHTALVQGSQVRDYIKWDDQPASVEAITESVLRGYRIAMTEPQGPVYLCFDTEVQEQPVAAPPFLPDVSRFAPPAAPSANREALKQAASLLVRARRPAIMAENAGRHHAAVPVLQELAELLVAAVVDVGQYHNFPSTHPLDLSLAADEAFGEADVVLGLDVYDLGGSASGIKDRASLTSTLHAEATFIHISLGDLLPDRWAAGNERLHPVDISIAADTAEALPELLALCRAEIDAGASSDGREERRRHLQQIHDDARRRALDQISGGWDERPISSYRLYQELWDLVKGSPWSLANAAGRVPLRAIWDITEPEHRIGCGRGGGLGYNTGASLGAALALKDSDRLCISVLGDGEFLMAPSTLWTAANSQIPLLYIIFNNRSYYNDEGHQEHMALTRGRPVENKGIGIQITGPETDFAALARSFGVAGFGPVADPAALRSSLEQAIHVVRDQRLPALVDVVTQPR